MNLLTYAARKFEVPLTHTVFRRTTKDTYDLKKISFTDNQLIAIYGEKDFEFEFDIVIRGTA